MSSRIMKTLSGSPWPETPADSVRSNVSNAKLVRVTVWLSGVDAGNHTKITHKNAGGDTTFGTITLENQEELFIAKDPTDTIQHDANATDPPTGGMTTVYFSTVAFTD